MAKVATNWSSNTSKAAGVTYSSSAVTYNSTTTAYSSADSAKDTFGKLPASWAKNAKTASSWNSNPLANTNLYVYDSATILYDSTRTYDGVVTGQDFGDQETPSLWTAA